MRTTSMNRCKTFGIEHVKFQTQVQAGDEIVAVDNQLVGDSPLQDLDHVISYIRTYHQE